jgi:DNA-3-methyladenine glycosylase I
MLSANSTPEVVRCPWAQAQELDRIYHDTEWGVPRADDPYLFELLTLEVAQAGMSWHLVLLKREGYRQAFDGFVPETVAAFTPEYVEHLLQDSRIIRNRAKIEASIRNAGLFLELQAKEGSFARYLWQWVDGKPLQPEYTDLAQIPARTELSERISRDLKKRGFGFLGPVGVQAFLQSVGVTNDHVTSCFRYPVVRELGEDFTLNA